MNTWAHRIEVPGLQTGFMRTIPLHASRERVTPLIQAFVFDAYGTLFDPDSVQAECNRLFPGSGSELSRLWRAKQLEYTWLRSLMDRYEDFWQVTDAALRFACAGLRLTCRPDQHQQLMQQYMHLRPYPDVHDSLAALVGRPLLILSNGSPQMLQPLVENAGLGNSFAALLSVDSVKTYKPSPRVYELGVKTTGLKKGSIGFVSSNSWDIAGAAAFGFTTFWINRSSAIPDDLGVVPHATLRTLAELPEL
jgi:2-haloacid dehalogenase